jgi:hypothetical protein
MPQPEVRAWWADVQHVRESIERRRADDDRRAAGARRRAEDYAPRWEDVDGADEPVAPRRRFARGGEELPAAPDPAAPAPRRTVQITGRTVPAPLVRDATPGARRRAARRSAVRVGRRPDRIALWAVGLAFFLILVAATSSSHAATPAPDRAPALVAPAAAR